MKWWSSGPLAAKSGTYVHSSQPSSPVTSRTGSSSPGTTGPRLSRNRWPGTPSESPISSSFDQLRVDHVDGAADRDRAEPVDVGRGAVGRLALDELGHPGAQPAGALLGDQRHDVAARDVDHDVAVAVEAAGGVRVELARLPVVARPRLPGERRVGRVDADAVDVGLEPQADRVRGHGLRQPDVQRVAGRRHLLEAVDLGALVEGGHVVAQRLAVDHRARAPPAPRG